VKPNIAFKLDKLIRHVNLLIHRYRMIYHILWEDIFLGLPDRGLLIFVLHFLILLMVDFRILIMLLISRSRNQLLVHSSDVILYSVFDYLCLVIMPILYYGSSFWVSTIVQRLHCCWQLMWATFNFIQILFVVHCTS